MLRWNWNAIVFIRRRTLAIFILVFIIVGLWLSTLIPIGNSTQGWTRGTEVDEKEVRSSPEPSERDKLVLEFHRKNDNLTRTKRLPDIIGIGAEKCGTGWLQYALQHHPMIKVGLNELRFFNNDKLYTRGMDYYRNLMPEATKNELIMEKSPGYLNFGSRFTPERLKSKLPKVKLWLILCDPVYRTFSDFVHEKELKHIQFHGSFDDFVNQYANEARLRLARAAGSFEQLAASWQNQDPKSHILTVGAYYYPLKRWLKYFPLKQLLVISGEELQHDSGQVIEQVQDFLGIPKLLLAEDFVKSPETGLYCVIPPVVANFKVGKGPRSCYTATEAGVKKGRTRSNSSFHKANPEKLQILRSFFKPHDEALFSFLGRKLW